MKKKLRKIFNKKNIFIFILGGLVFGTIGVSAATLLSSSDVTYDNSSSGMSATTVQDALDELYEKSKNNKPSIKIDGVTVETGFISSNGLYADSVESGRYIYRGSNPNNYIIFNSEIWRILAIESDGTLKIMKASSIGDIAYDTNLSGSWSSATLNTYLNGTYYNSLSTTAKSYIQRHSFNVGNVGNDMSSLEATINEEKSDTWTGNIALATVSDYIKADIDFTNCGSIEDNSSNADGSICYNTNYINTMGSGQIFLLSLDASGTDFAWVVNVYNRGDVNCNHVYIDYYGVLPVLYLRSDITLSGSGTSSDPYTIVG